MPPSSPFRRRGSLAVLLSTSALLGSGLSVGALAAGGAFDGGTTTVVERAATATTPISTTTTTEALDAGALYAAASPGVVDIAVAGASGGGTGTGFVVDEDGHVVTAAHVVDGASSVKVEFQDGATRTAKVLGVDDATDVAVLAVDPSGLELHPLTLGSSASLAVGDELAAIGDPFGYQRSISTGIVSGVDRTIEAPNGFTVAHAIQTDAAINPGNSGGPVLDAAGEVVGIADQIATGGSGADQSSGVGFAVPIDLVKTSLKTLEAGGTVRHAYLGVSTGDATSGQGAQIGQVAAGGPAASAGLRAGDVVTRFGDAAVSDSNELVAAIATHRPGDEVAVTVRRGSDTRRTTVTLGTQPASTQP